MPLRKKLRKKLDLFGLYVTSLLQKRRNAEFLRGIKTYCMFVGCPRTGHSLIGSLLDAHPRIVIAHELDALRLFYRGFSRRQVFHLLLENSRKMAASGRSHHGYSYAVPNQWQGRFEQLQVLGDKKGAASAWRLYLNPDFLEFVRNRIAIDLKFVHVIRNPYDVLATMSRRSRHKTLDTHIDLFFQLCSSIERLKKRSQDFQIYDVRLESFIEDPKPHLEDLCSFIGVKAEARYLEDCASIVFESPKRSRFDIEWSRESIAKVRERMEGFSFLSGYTYDEENAAPESAPRQRRSVLGRNNNLGMVIAGKLLLPEAYTMMDGILASFPV
jgi:Sulfotransferase family